MSILIPMARQRGNVLFSTLFIALLASLLIGSLLVLAQQHNYLTGRSMTWNSEIPIAEAGIEEALTHLNSNPAHLQDNGWDVSNKKYSKTRTDLTTEGYYYVTFTNIINPIIVSVGYARVPLSTNYTSRTIVAYAKRNPPRWGFVGKTNVTMNGNPYVDSYDSSNPRYSSGGMYDPAKAHDQAGVATLSNKTNAIVATKIYGTAATGPGGTVSGSVGDGEYLSGSSGQQEGHVRDDFNTPIPDVSAPTNWSPKAITLFNQILGGFKYDYVLDAGDYQFDTAIKLSGSTGKSGIAITGKARLWFKSDFTMSGGPYVYLAPGASLEIYISGNMDMSGHCVMNSTGIPGNCAIYGLPTCTSIKYTGDAKAYCSLYAPEATVSVGGDFDFFGSAVGNSLQFSGSAAVHYDEALGAEVSPTYSITAWEER